VLDFHNPTFRLFTGTPPSRSATDSSRLQTYLNAGGGIGLFYDGAEPMALKPIIRLHDFPQGEATVRLDLPGQTTYAKPLPDSRTPLIWNVPQAAQDAELDYEARFDHNLNFVWRAPGSNLVRNNSWATARDVKLIEFVRGQGYRVSEVGTLAAGAKATFKPGPLLDFEVAVRELDRTLRGEALSAGMSDEETQTFFDTYAWATRVVARSCQELGAVAVYRLEGEDYDALFPLTVSPAPAEMKRVIWVDSYVPDRVTSARAVHPRLAYPVQARGAQGSYHEYGFFKETYGGDALDDMDQWGWHFYDQMLVDCTNVWSSPPYWMEGQFFFNRWSSSPLANALSQGVPALYGQTTGGITVSNDADILLTGDEDCISADSTTFPYGSYPAVLVSRGTASGGKIFGASDIAFLEDYGNNLTFGRNLFDFLHRPQLDSVPDIDIPQAVVFKALAEGSTGNSIAYIYNRGGAPLTLTTALPSAAWLNVSGPTTTTVAAGDSAAYTFTWSSAGMTAGFYQAWWDIQSNDPNEGSLHWPVLFRVGTPSAVNPQQPHGALARSFDLLPPFPNPFNPSTMLSFELAVSGKVSFELCNILGERVATLAEGVWSPGRHDLRVDLSSRAAGLYFVRGQCAGTMVVRKLVLLK